MNEKTGLGVAFTLLSALCYAIQTAVVKHTAIQISIPVLVFIQSLISLVLLIPLLYNKHNIAFFNVKKFSSVKKAHFIRAIFSLGISYFLFFALQKQPYFDSILLYNTFPILIPFVSFFVLKQKIQSNIWIFIVLGFIGVALTFNPDAGILSYASVFALCSAICAAVSITMIRKISLHDNSIKSLYYYFLISTVLSGLLALKYFNFEAIMSASLLSLIAIGILFFCVQYFLTLAATHTNTVVVSILYYFNVVFSLIISLSIFHEMTSNIVMIGMVLILLGGIGVLIMQKKNNSSRASLMINK